MKTLKILRHTFNETFMAILRFRLLINSSCWLEVYITKFVYTDFKLVKIDTN